MKKNMGSIDKFIRLVIAGAFLLLYFFGQLGAITGTVLLVLAIVFILTSFISFCPLYTLVGINTCKKQ